MKQPGLLRQSCMLREKQAFCVEKLGYLIFPTCVLVTHNYVKYTCVLVTVSIFE